MDKTEACAVLSEELSHYRGFSYSDLLARVDKSESVERISSSGTTYQIEMQVVVDDPQLGTLRVVGAIDNGTFWRGLSPLSDSFIIAPGGSFVGE